MVFGDEDYNGNLYRRHETLCMPRDPKTLQQQVRDMRLKMHQHLGSHQVNEFDLKAILVGSLILNLSHNT